MSRKKHRGKKPTPAAAGEIRIPPPLQAVSSFQLPPGVKGQLWQAAAQLLDCRVEEITKDTVLGEAGEDALTIACALLRRSIRCGNAYSLTVGQLLAYADKK